MSGQLWLLTDMMDPNTKMGTAWGTWGVGSPESCATSKQAAWNLGHVCKSTSLNGRRQLDEAIFMELIPRGDGCFFSPFSIFDV
jgi:hypothetical protein